MNLPVQLLKDNNVFCPLGKNEMVILILVWLEERIQGIKEGTTRKAEFVTLAEPQQLLSHLAGGGWLASQD